LHRRVGRSQSQSQRSLCPCWKLNPSSLVIQPIVKLLYWLIRHGTKLCIRYVQINLTAWWTLRPCTDIHGNELKDYWALGRRQWIFVCLGTPCVLVLVCACKELIFCYTVDWNKKCCTVWIINFMLVRSNCKLLYMVCLWWESLTCVLMWPWCFFNNRMPVNWERLCSSDTSQSKTNIVSFLRNGTC
jgi:hypothetical protein